MNKYKIAILTEQINTHSGSRAAIELAKQLMPINKSIRLYSYRNNLDQQEMNKLKKHKLKITTFKKSAIIGKFFPNLKLLKILRHARPDFVIFCGTLPFFLSAKLAGIKIIRIYMGTQFDAYLENKLPNESKNLPGIIINYICNIYIYLNELVTIKLSTHIITISKFTALELYRLYNRKTDCIIYLGGNHLPKVNTKKIENDKTLKLLTISRITPYKGFHILIKEVNKLKNTSLTIVGTAEKKNYLKYLKTISASNIIFKNELTNLDIAKLYANSDVYVTADRNLFFGFPSAEASFFGLPSIAFSYAAANELIDDNKSGYIVKNGNDFSAAINNYLKNPKLVSTMGNNARIKAENNFKWSKIAANYQQAINSFNRDK